MVDHRILLWLIGAPEERKETMSTRIRMARFLSVAAILIGICASAGQPVSANGCDPAYVTQVGNTFIVAPTGADDTANLQCALDAAAAAGPGSTVQLMDGTYWTGLVAVDTFHGSLVGAGKERTTVTTIPDMSCPPWPTWLQFGEGDVRVADLTFGVTDPYPCQAWFNPVDDPDLLYPRHDLAVIVAIGGGMLDPSYDWSDPDTVYASSSVENVAFRGPPLDAENPGYFGVTSGLYIGAPLQAGPTGGLGRGLPMVGDHSVTNCSFENTWQAIVTFGLTDGSLTVGGSASQGNTFAHVYLGLRSFDHDNSSIEFSHNEVTAIAPYGAGVVAQQTERPWEYSYPWPAPTQYLIRQNTLDVAGPVDAIAIMDLGPAFGEGAKVHAVVSQNRLRLDLAAGLCGGIWALGAQEVLVTSNQFAGSAGAGIYFGFQGLPSSGWTMIGNNVQNLDADVASIWLGEDTSHCTVVGGSSKANVLDEGEDNIIAGVNNMGGNPPGPEIREAMQRKLEILSRFP
jgi:hypothetical protein